jgi:tellurite resistance protein TehA-like permease
MRNRVTTQQMHKRMAVASWILPLVALVFIAVAGEHSIFSLQVSARARDRSMGYDIVALSALGTGLMLAVYCLTYGWHRVPRRFGSHAIAGLVLAMVVIGLGLLSIVLNHPVAVAPHGP